VSPLVTVLELSALLRVSAKTIYRWVAERTVPFVKIGKAVRFDRDAVLAHFRSQTGEPCPLSIPLIPRAGSLKIGNSQRRPFVKKGDGNGS